MLGDAGTGRRTVATRATILGLPSVVHQLLNLVISVLHLSLTSCKVNLANLETRGPGLGLIRVDVDLAAGHGGQLANLIPGAADNNADKLVGNGDGLLGQARSKRVSVDIAGGDAAEDVFLGAVHAGSRAGQLDLRGGPHFVDDQLDVHIVGGSDGGDGLTLLANDQTAFA